ncbi:MAG TPA: hypothetical protein VGH14_19475 [Solirubrobacterales bacterium]
MLLHVTARLLEELPDAGPVEIADAAPAFGDDAAASELLSADDLLLVESVRAALAKIEAALSAAAENPPTHSVRAALDGADALMPGELMTGRDSPVARFLPSLVIVDQIERQHSQCEPPR